MRKVGKDGYHCCVMCGKGAKEVELSLEPTRSQLLFGGFNVKMEHRCEDCEKKVCDWANKLIKINLGTTK